MGSLEIASSTGPEGKTVLQNGYILYCQPYENRTHIFILETIQHFNVFQLLTSNYISLNIFLPTINENDSQICT